MTAKQRNTQIDVQSIIDVQTYQPLEKLGTIYLSPLPSTLLVPPSIVDSEGASVKDGEAAQLICSAKGFPVPEIVWLREDTGMVFEEVSVGVSNHVS